MAPPQPAPNRRAWKPEIVATLMLALPLVLSNLAQIAMTVTDVMFIGRLGSQQLAASALGANLYSAIAFFALGLVSATAPMPRARRRAAQRRARRAADGAPGAVDGRADFAARLPGAVARRTDPAAAAPAARAGGAGR